MQPINSYNNTPNFTARCVQIKDAQWVCHAINSTFPHFSTTKFMPFYTNMCARTFPEIPKDKLPTSIQGLHELLNSYQKPNLLQIIRFKILKLFGKNFTDIESIQQNLKILNRATELSKKIINLRNAPKTKGLTDLENALNCVENHMGNCYENAILAEFILRLNGIKNVKFASIHNSKTGLGIDHCVCVVSKDDEPFKSVKDIIIIDPWLGQADFLRNMDTLYKKQMNDIFGITKDTKLDYVSMDSVSLTDEQIAYYRSKYPSLIFPSKTRKIFQTNGSK